MAINVRARKEESKSFSFNYNVGMFIFEPVCFNPSLDVLKKHGVEYVKQEPDYSKKCEIWFRGVSPAIKDKMYSISLWRESSNPPKPNDKGEIKFLMMDKWGNASWEFAKSYNEAVQKMKESHESKGWAWFDFDSCFQTSTEDMQALHSLIRILAGYALRGNAKKIAEADRENEMLKESDYPFKPADLSKHNPKSMVDFFKQLIAAKIKVAMPLVLTSKNKDGKVYVQEVLTTMLVKQVMDGEETCPGAISDMKYLMSLPSFKLRAGWVFQAEPKTLTDEEARKLLAPPSLLDDDSTSSQDVLEDGEELD